MPKKITIRGIIGLSENATPEFLESELAGAGDVDIKFASPGGLVMPGIEMGNMIRRHPGKTTATMVGLAASMSAHIPMKADIVLAEDDAVFVIHNVMGGMFGGDFRDADKLSLRLRSLRDMLAMVFVSKTGKSLEEMQILMNEESFFYGEEIVNEGFADSIVPASAKDEGRNKDTAIALAHAEIENCISIMHKSEAKVKEDFEQATNYFNMLDFTIENKEPAPDVDVDINEDSVNGGGDKSQEVKSMDKDTLKREHPAVYNAILGEGVDAERDRVKGHIEMSKSSGAVEFAHECIVDGTDLTNQTVIAKYMGASMNKKAVDDRAADDPDASTTTGVVIEGDEVEENALLGRVMALSKKKGAAIKMSAAQ